MKRKRFFILVILFLTIFSFGLDIGEVFGTSPSIKELQEQLSTSIDDTLSEVDFSSLQEIVDEFDENQTKMFSIKNIKSKVKDVMNGNAKISYESILGAIVSVVFEIIADYLPMFALLVSVGVLSSILGNIKGKFNEKTVGEVVHFACFCVVILVVSTLIKSLITNATSSINSMQNQMGAVFPILLTFMTAIGASAGATVYQPALAIFTTLSSKIFSGIIIPIFIASFAFGIIGNLSNNVKLDKFNSFLSSLFKWLVGVLFTFFFAILSIQGITAGTFDSVSIRTVKFTMSSYVPILGGYLSQGMDMVLASSILIKNSVGFVGILILISTIISPILEIVVVSLLLKMASAILQPLNNEKISNFLHSTSKSIMMLSTCLIVVAFMYFIMIGLMMGSANVI